MRLPLVLLAIVAAVAGIWALATDRLLLSIGLDVLAATLFGSPVYRPKPGEHPHAMPRDTHFD
jgi:hypothetical protein